MGRVPMQQQMMAICRLTDLAEAILMIDTSKPLFCDSETYNNTKHYDGLLFGKVRLAQFMQEGWSKAVVVDIKFDSDPEATAKLDNLVHSCKVVGQNFGYDYATLQECRGNTIRRIDLDKYEDTLILARELYPLQKSENLHHRYSLDLIYENVLGFDPYEYYKLDKQKLQKSNWAGILTPTHILYAALDVYYLPQLYARMKETERKYLEVLSPQGVENYKIRVHNAHLAVDVGLVMQSVGLRLDIDKAYEYVAKYTKQKEEYYAKLGNPKNLSYVTVRKLFNSDKSDKTFLSFRAYASNDPKAIDVINARQGESRARTATKWLELQHDLGGVYGHFSPNTTTGRFSSKQENMQNQPRDSKDLFIAPYGAVIIGFDYAQIELRTMCALTGDERMYSVFKSLGDIHQNTQDMCGVTERRVAKQINFGNLYGMGAKKFQELLVLDGIYIDIDEITRMRQAFRATYIRVPESHEKGVHNTKHGIPNYSILGHPYYSKFFNQMNNLYNQASGTSEVAKMFFRFADELGFVYNDVIELSLQVHDSNLFYYYGKLDYIEHYTYALGLLAQKAWWYCLNLGYNNGTCVYNDIPMPVEVGMSDSWGGVDDNIITNMIGNEYASDPAKMDAWLAEFKLTIHDKNVIEVLTK